MDTAKLGKGNAVDLKGRIALVTGANKGIGFETAKQLGKLGASVIVAARDPSRVAQAVQKLKDMSVDANPVTLDVTDDASITRAAEDIAATFGHVDILVNNAGILGGVGANALPTNTTRSGMKEIFETNVFGVVAVTNAFVPLLRKSQHPRIVNISSEVGSFESTTNPEHPFFGLQELGYATSKTAVNMVTVLYSKQLSPEGFRVNAAIPGWTATDFNDFHGPRTAAEAASVAVALATVADDGPTGTFWGALAAKDNQYGILGW